MNQYTKTSNFLDAINQYAQKQKKKIEEDVERFRAEKIEQATEEGLEDAYRLLQNEISRRKAAILTEYASKENRARVELFETRKDMLSQIETGVRETLIAFSATEAYSQKLLSYAKEIDACFDGRECTVFLSPNDNNKAYEIKSIIRNATVKTDESIRLGGIKAYCSELKIIADCTYDTKLSDEMNLFTRSAKLEVM